MRIKNPELKDPGSFRIIRPEPAAPTLMRVEGPAAFRSFAMFYDRHAVFLPRYNDHAFYARLAEQPAGMVTFTGKQYPWPIGGPTFSMMSRPLPIRRRVRARRFAGASPTCG